MSTSKDFGLQMALSVTKSELLHFGYWKEGDPVDFQTISDAQQRYVDEVLSYIPDNTKSILDIGCGTGEVSLQLKNRGFDVELVSPDILLNENILKKHPDKKSLHCCKFEDFEATRQYDLLLQMESCQYVRLERGFNRFKEALAPGGAILISDTFRKEPTKDYKDWHVLSDFYDAVERHGFVIEKSRDISIQTAPTAILGTRIYQDYMMPISSNILSSIRDSIGKKRLSRIFIGIIKRIFKKKLERLSSDFYERVPRLLDKENYLNKVCYMIFLLREKAS